jgi:hypothetical protein
MLLGRSPIIPIHGMAGLGKSSNRVDSCTRQNYGDSGTHLGAGTVHQPSMARPYRRRLGLRSPCRRVGVFLFFALFLILDTGQRAAGGLLERVRFKRRLRTLTEIERRTLSELFNAETSRIIAWPHDERIRSLHNANFLVALPGEVYGRKTYILSPAIRKWISKKQLPV